LVEGVISVPFSSIEAKDLLPFDIIINESGEVFEIDALEQLDEQFAVYMTNENGDQLIENFTPETVMGFVDNNEDFTRKELNEEIELFEDEHKKVKLNKIMHGDVKKYKVYVKNDKGNVVKVNFGDPNMEIKRDNPARRRNFRARHHCENPGPRWKARYWACKTWSAKPVSAMLKEEAESLEESKNKPKDPKKWSSCIAQAKAKFDVYPSAYANAWAAKCYKEKKGKWKAVNEDIVNNTLDSVNNLEYNPNLWGHLNDSK
jgi:hypothetical protein